LQVNALTPVIEQPWW